MKLKAETCFREVGINELVYWVEVTDEFGQVVLRIDLKKDHLDAAHMMCNMINKREPNLPQRQYSLTDQMKDVALIANQIGCYDANDWIRKHFFKEA